MGAQLGRLATDHTASHGNYMSATDRLSLSLWSFVAFFRYHNLLINLARRIRYWLSDFSSSSFITHLATLQPNRAIRRTRFLIECILFI